LRFDANSATSVTEPGSNRVSPISAAKFFEYESYAFTIVAKTIDNAISNTITGTFLLHCNANSAILENAAFQNSLEQREYTIFQTSYQYTMVQLINTDFTSTTGCPVAKYEIWDETNNYLSPYYGNQLKFATPCSEKCKGIQV
jgi:hypothetical protein